MSTLSTKIDLRYIPTQILDQGSLNTCAENTLASTVDITMKLAGDPLPMISRMQSYTDARIAAGEFGPQYGDIGTYTQVMLGVASSKGLAPESMWAYDYNNLYQVPPQNVYDAASHHKLTSYATIGLYQNYGGIANSIGKALAEGKAVMLSFNARDYLYGEYGLPLDQQSGGGDGPQIGGHMVTIVGKDDNLNGGSYIVQNSWGSGWGAGGYGTIKYSQFGSHIDDFKAAYVITGFDNHNFVYTDARVNVAQHYAAILDRAAEVSGLDWWASANLSDLSLTSALLNSAEGVSKYGSLTNSQFVESMYGNVLGRHSDADGMNFYTNLLSNGYSRADVMNMVINAVEAPNAEAVAHDYLINKTNLSSYISIALQYQGGKDLVTHNALESVTSDANQVELIKVGIPENLGYVF